MFKNSYQQIIIGVVIGLLIFGGIFYLARNVLKLPGIPGKTAPATTQPPSTQTAPIAQVTKQTRAEIDVNSETASWRSVKNPKYNFSVKFPQEVTTITQSLKTGQISFPFSKNCQGSICEGIYLTAADIPPGTALKAALDKGLQGKTSSYQNGGTTSDIEVAGLKGLESFKSAQTSTDFDQDSIYFLKSNLLFILDLYTSKEKSAVNIRNFNLMLKTFQFL